jgi:hypothetical protein
MNKSEEGNDLIYRVAKVIIPLLQRRKWKIKYLNEFNYVLSVCRYT